MSKRCSPLSRCLTLPGTAFALLLLVVLTFHTGGLASECTLGTPTVYIMSQGDVALGSVFDLGIGMCNDTTLAHGFGGFDLLITYDPQALTFLGASKGALLDSCGWEYLEYRQGLLVPGKYAVRIVAVADTGNDGNHPSCHLEGRLGELASLQFRMTSDSAYMFNNITYASFYWNDCGDNVLISPANDSVFLSKGVTDWGGGPYPPPSSLGTTHGAPDTCLQTSSGRIPFRLTYFMAGFVNTWPHSDSISPRGDLNLNGIAYEIADFLVYENYFLHGLDALPEIGRAMSIAASDINADGATLTYRDLVYMQKIIVGDTLPNPKQFNGKAITARFFQDTTAHTIGSSSPAGLAGAYMLVKGDIIPTFVIPAGMAQNYYFDGVYTRIVIVGSMSMPYATGTWLTYQGNGTLEYVSTTDWHNAEMIAQINGDIFNCGDFNGDGGLDISDAVYLIYFIFSGGPSPLDNRYGDINCDGVCDISDAVYLMQFIFAGGAVPCASCK